MMQRERNEEGKERSLFLVTMSCYWKIFFHYHLWTNCLTENKEKQTCDGFCWDGCFCRVRVGADRESTRGATNRLWVLSVAQERLPWLKSRLRLWGSPDPPGNYFLGSEHGVEGSKINSQFLPLKSF